MEDLSKPPVADPRYGTFSPPSPPSPPPSSIRLPRPPPFTGNQYHHLHPVPPPTYTAIPVGYQSLPYSALVEGIPLVEPRLPCCGIGIGWALFLSGFFLAAIPWYVGVFILLFVAIDFREKPGLVACTVAAALATVPIILKTFDDYIYG